jgi:hypothetical protein
VPAAPRGKCRFRIPGRLYSRCLNISGRGSVPIELTISVRLSIGGCVEWEGVPQLMDRLRFVRRSKISTSGRGPGVADSRRQRFYRPSSNWKTMRHSGIAHIMVPMDRF